MSTGCSFNAVHTEYLLGVSTILEIVHDTCTAIWDRLEEDYMRTTNDSEAWLKVANNFHRLTSFPNCIGALGGKRIETRNKSSSGETFSALLLAVANADYSFAAVEVCTLDEGDNYNPCDFFKESKFGRLLKNGELNVPSPRCLPSDEEGSPMPFLLTAGEAFTLSDNILCPYPSRKSMDEVDCRIFNRRLDQANRMVECCFAMMAKKWRILDRTFDVNLASCEAIAKAVCMLHNFVRKHDGFRFEDTLYRSSLKELQQPTNRGTKAGLKTRDYFAQYFTSPRGSVPWQNEHKMKTLVT